MSRADLIAHRELADLAGRRGGKASATNHRAGHRCQWSARLLPEPGLTAFGECGDTFGEIITGEQLNLLSQLAIQDFRNRTDRLGEHRLIAP